MLSNTEKLDNKKTEKENPRVFVSYSHDSEEHKKWVKKLSTHLITHGVEVILDQWDLEFGDDLPFFMEQGLNKSHLVICVCSENYVNKCDELKGGTGYEKRILSSKLYKRANENFIIPILRNNNSKQRFPTFLGEPLAIDFRDDKNYFNAYVNLIQRIYDQSNKPKLGKNPFNKELSQKIIEKTKIEQIKYHSPGMEGVIEFDYTNNNGFYKLGYGDYLFNTRWNTAADDCIHVLAGDYGNNLMLGVSKNQRDFPKKQDIFQFDFSSTQRTVFTDDVIVLKNLEGNFVAIKLGKIIDKSRGHKESKITFTYKIYTNSKN